MLHAWAIPDMTVDCRLLSHAPPITAADGPMASLVVGGLH